MFRWFLQYKTTTNVLYAQLHNFGVHTAVV